jgi:tetratricopeptide (TPR) repeat protein
MRLKPKTVRRLTLVGAVGVALLVTAFALVFVRKWQGERLTERFRERALIAYQERDYSKTIECAGSFLKRGDQRDPEILLAYAEARAALEEPDHRHIPDAISFYQRYLEVRPDDREVRARVAQLYNACGFFVEAGETARMLRPAELAQTTAEHLEVLEQEAFALVGARQFSGPLNALLDRIMELDALNVYGVLLRVDAISQLDPQGRFAQPARAWAESFLAEHPEEPVALTAAAAARLIRPNQEDRQQALEWLSMAANIDAATARRLGPGKYESRVLATRLCDSLDYLRAADHALETLRDADDRLGDVDLTARLVRRLWQEHAHEEVVRRTQELDARDPNAHPVMVGLRALSLRALNRDQEAAAIAQALKGREGDYRVSSWTRALPLAEAEEEPDLVRRVSDLRNLCRDNPNEPIFHAWLAEALAALGRNDEARQAWREATELPQGATWALPKLRTAETFLQDRRLEDALRSVQEAAQIARNRAVVNVVLMEVHAARVQKGLDSIDSSQLLDHVRQLDEALARAGDSESLLRLRERLIVPRIVFLARSQGRDAAREAALEVLESDRSLRSETIQRLAVAGTIERLGIEDACAARAGSGGADSAAVQFGRSLELAASDRPQEGKRLLADALKQRPQDADLHIAYARYLERIGDEAALPAWKQAGGRFATNLGVQRACLSSAVIAADREFVEEAIRRYASVAGLEVGSEDVVIRMARARMLLHGRPTARDRDRAVGVLTAVISHQPTLVEPKLLIASALSMSDRERSIQPDLPRATAALSDALAQEPGAATVAIELSRLLQLQGQFDRAREHLNRIAGSSTVDIDLRRRAAEMLIAQGNSTPVADRALQEIADKLGDNAPAGVLVALAEIHAGQRRASEAAAIYERLAARPSLDVDSAYMVARHYLHIGEPTRAEEVLAGLNPAELKPGARQLIQARLAAERGDIQAAAEQFEQAIRQGNNSPELWRQYVAMYLRRADFDDAMALTERALNALPGDLTLLVLQKQSALLAEGAADADLGPLVKALAGDPSASNAEEILRSVKAARDRGELHTIAGLTRLADRFAASAPVQMYAANRMMRMDPARAAVIMNKAMAVNPADPGTARLAAEIYLQLGNWRELLAAATAWRNRDGSRSAEPDLAIAQAYLGMNQFEHGLKVLQPRLAGALANPDADSLSLGILNIYARLLIGAGREQEARAVLEPAFKTSQQARIMVGMRLAGEQFSSYLSSRRWLNEVAALAPESPLDQLAAAGTLSVLASRFPEHSESLLNEAKAILQKLTNDPETTTGLVYESLGIVLHRLNDPTAAEEAYRQAIALDPQRGVALNNLANIAMERDLDEALALALAAVQTANPPHPNHLDTLAAVHFRRASRGGPGVDVTAEYAAAAEMYLALGRLQPGNLEAVERASSAAILGSRYDIAVPCLEQLLLSGARPATMAQYHNNLAAVLLRLNRSQEDLQRARQLAERAVQADERPAYLDTLGWVCLAVGVRGEAEQAFRRAMKLHGDRQVLTSAVLGLATVLAGGESVQRSEATRLLAQLEAGSLNEEDRARLDRVQLLLAGEVR